MWNDKDDDKLYHHQKASVISVTAPRLKGHEDLSSAQNSLNEMKDLLRTLHISVVDEYIQQRKQVDPAYICGKGLLLEMAEKAKEEHGHHLLVYDLELSAGQINAIKKATQMDVVDRTYIILEIFARHAQTKAAKIQIEISRLNYLLPRLAGFWGHLGRQRGGIGVRGGEGEKQIELDRRLVRQRITSLKRELISLKKSRQEQNKKRQKQTYTCALVGYTNAGKSSLMNRLCRVNVLEEDKLFATLDSTYRMLSPDTRPPMILIDTVGFLDNLPNTLIDGFKTTLESAQTADLLLIVCDISDPQYQRKLEVTQEVLRELQLESKEQIIVFNKEDLLDHPHKKKIIARAHKNSFVLSSFDHQKVGELRSHVINKLLEHRPHLDVFIPYDRGDIHATLAKKTSILAQHCYEKGIYYQLKAPPFILDALNLEDYVLSAEKVKALRGE